MVEKLDAKAHTLSPLTIGDHVRVQNQAGLKPKMWDKTGVVLENRDHNQVVVRVDGWRRVTLRNRKFVRKCMLYAMTGVNFTQTTQNNLFPHSQSTPALARENSARQQEQSTPNARLANTPPRDLNTTIPEAGNPTRIAQHTENQKI
jgi:hypothetical protein